MHRKQSSKYLSECASCLSRRLVVTCSTLQRGHTPHNERFFVGSPPLTSPARGRLAAAFGFETPLPMTSFRSQRALRNSCVCGCLWLASTWFGSAAYWPFPCYKSLPYTMNSILSKLQPSVAASKAAGCEIERYNKLEARQCRIYAPHRCVQQRFRLSPLWNDDLWNRSLVPLNASLL